MTCAKCKYFIKDKIGDGTGIGLCQVYEDYKLKTDNKNALIKLGNSYNCDVFGRVVELIVRNLKMKIEDTLKEREERYGDFLNHATITQNIKEAMNDGKWHDLSADKKEALEMIAHKIGRILNGDPNYHDSWHDIVGYAKLVADSLVKKQ